VIDVLVEAVDDCIARVRKTGWRGLGAQDWLIVAGAVLLVGVAIVVAIGLFLL
jgi:hypothetical protein